MATISDMQAIQILRQTNDKAFEAAAKSQIASMSSELGAKEAQVKTAIHDAHGQFTDSVTKFSASGIGSLLNMKLAAKGSEPAKSIRQQKDEADAKYQARVAAQSTKDQARRSGIQAASQNGQIATLVDKAQDAMSQAVGGQAEMNKAKVDGKIADLSDTMAKSQQEGAKNLRDAAMKAQDTVTEMQRSIFDRQKQAADNAVR